MNKNDTIGQIICLPAKFNDPETNESIYSLLKATGYFELYDQIRESDIAKALAKQPECINQWLSWSDDKRTGSGWVFAKNSSGNYIVGYFPAAPGFEQKEYANIIEACANFIKKEIEEIRTIK
jgi:hypothetical protein